MTHLTRGPVLMRAALIPATLVLFVLVSGFLAQVKLIPCSIAVGVQNGTFWRVGEAVLLGPP